MDQFDSYEKLLENQKNEVWIEVDVPGFDGYEVSSFGRGWDCIKNEYLPLKIADNGRIYWELNYTENGQRTNKTKIVPAHELIAFMFLPNPKDYIFVTHNTRNFSNNQVENLRWASENEYKLYKQVCKSDIEKYEKMRRAQWVQM